MAVPWYRVSDRAALLLIVKRSEIAFIVTRRQDKEQQRVGSLLRSALEPKGRRPSSQCREGYAVDGFTDTWDVEGCSVHKGGPAKSGEVKRTLRRNCWGVTRRMRTEMGPDRKRELGK